MSTQSVAEKMIEIIKNLGKISIFLAAKPQLNPCGIRN